MSVRGYEYDFTLRSAVYSSWVKTVQTTIDFYSNRQNAKEAQKLGEVSETFVQTCREVGEG